MVDLLAFLLGTGAEQSVFNLIAEFLLALSLRSIAEDLAADAVWKTSGFVVSRLGRKDLSELFKQALKDAMKSSTIGYDNIRKVRTKQILKALASEKSNEALRRYATPSSLANFDNNTFLNDLSTQLAHSIQDRVGLPEHELDSYMIDAMRLFKDALFRRVARDQELCNIVTLNLGSKTSARLESASKGIEAIGKRTTTPFPSFTVLPVSDFRELEKVLRYNPPKTSLHEYVTRKEVEFDPSGKKMLIIGTPGSGKTTTMTRLLERLSEGKIVAIHRSFSSRDIEDLINHTPTDEPVVLVWDDLHQVSEPSLIPNVINKLEEISTRLTVILAVRSTEYDILHKQISEHFWETFDEKRMVDLDVAQILHLVEICKRRLDVTIEENVATRLSLRIHSTDPTPMYVVSTMLLFQGRTMCEEDIHTIPPRTLSIWTELFRQLDRNAPHAANVLRSLKLLDSASVPPVHQIVLQIYEHLLRGDAGQFQSNIVRLEDMGWIRKADEFYLCHDLQLEAVDIPQWPSSLGLLPERLTLSDQTKVTILHNLGLLAAQRGTYEDAIPLYNASLEISRKLRDQSGIVRTLHELGNVECFRGNYDEAKRLYDQSLEINRNLGDQAGIALTIHQLANMEWLKGNYDEAKKLYDQNLETSRKLGDQAGIARTIHQLATIEHRRSNYDEAKKLYDQSLDISRKLGDQSGTASVLHQLAMIEQHRGNYHEARKLYARSLDISRKLGDQSGIAKAIGQVANMEVDKGNYGEAENLYNEAKAIFEKLGDQAGMAATFHGLARIERMKAHHDEAKKLYDQSLEIEQKLGDQAGIAATLGELGCLYEQKGNPEAAEKYYQQALQIFEKLGISEYATVTRNGLERIRRLKQKP